MAPDDSYPSNRPRTSFRNPDPIHGAEKDKHNRHRAGQQVHAALRHCIQLEEVLEILRKTCQKWGKGACHFI